MNRDIEANPTNTPEKLEQIVMDYSEIIRTKILERSFGNGQKMWKEGKTGSIWA